MEKLREQNAELQKQNDELRAQLASLETELGKVKGNRSRLLPPCKEKGIAAGPLFRATIEGPHSFRVGEVVYDLRGLMAAFSVQVAQAKAAGCVQSVRISHDGSVTLHDYLTAASELKQQFYVTEDVGGN